MLLQHAWLAPLEGMNMITEEDEEEEENGTTIPPSSTRRESESFQLDPEGNPWIDQEVGSWVREQIRKRKEGLLGKHRKPALHAAPLDAMPTSPVKGSATAGAVAV